MSQNLGLGTVSQSVPRSVSSSVTSSSPLSSAGPATSGSTNSIDSSKSALASNGPVLRRDRDREGFVKTRCSSLIGSFPPNSQISPAQVVVVGGNQEHDVPQSVMRVELLTVHMLRAHTQQNHIKQ